MTVKLRCPVCDLYKRNLAPSRSRESVPLGHLVEARPASDFFDVDALIQSIKHTCGSDVAIRNVASRSQQNPTGFRKIVLIRCKAGHQVRLHMWDKASPPNVQIRCHNHRWDFLSLVLHGCLLNDSYLALDGAALRKFAVGIGPPSQRREISDLGLTSACLTSTKRISGGASYFQSASIFHWTRATGPSATVVLQDRARTERSIAIQRDWLEDAPSPPLDSRVLWDDLQLCLAALSKLKLAKRSP